MKTSRLEIFKLLSLPLSLLALSFAGFLLVKSHYDETSREPTSTEELNTPPSEEKISRLNRAPNFKKPGTSIDLDISGGEMFRDQPTELTAAVTVSHAIAQLDLVWHLPPDVEIVAGLQTSSLLNLSAGEMRSVKVTLVSHTDSNRQIHIEASYLQGEQKIGTTTQYNTVDQKVKLVSSRTKEKRIWQ